MRAYTLQMDMLREVDALAHEYNGYSASAGGLAERQRVVDAIHDLVATALGVDTSAYPAEDACKRLEID